MSAASGGRPLTGSDVERKAIEVIAERGWTQGTMGAHGGPVCLAGALRCTATPGEGRNGTWWRNRLRFVVEVAAEQYPDFIFAGGSIPWWNDAPDRTVDEVIAVLEKAAIRRDEAVA